MLRQRAATGQSRNDAIGPMRALASKLNHLWRLVRRPLKDLGYLSKGLVRVTTIVVVWQSEYSWLCTSPSNLYFTAATALAVYCYLPCGRISDFLAN